MDDEFHICVECGIEFDPAPWTEGEYCDSCLLDWERWDQDDRDSYRESDEPESE